MTTEQIKANNRQYYLEHRDELIKSQTERYLKNKDKYNERKRQYYRENAERIREERKLYRKTNGDKCRLYLIKNKDRIRNNRLKREYGITLEQYKKMLKDQNECCALCKNKRPLRVDHDHRTGKVRGLLCDKCNLSLGLLEENEVAIENIKTYLTKYANGV